MHKFIIVADFLSIPDWIRLTNHSQRLPQKEKDWHSEGSVLAEPGPDPPLHTTVDQADVLTTLTKITLNLTITKNIWGSLHPSLGHSDTW